MLRQVHENSDVFKFSKNKRQLTVPQLMQNLLMLIDNSVSSTNHMIMTHPELLVGKRIRHCFQVEDELVWFNGTVINLNPVSMEYEIQYDGEEDTCSFTLLDDIVSGDLELQ